MVGNAKTLSYQAFSPNRGVDLTHKPGLFAITYNILVQINSSESLRLTFISASIESVSHVDGIIEIPLEDLTSLGLIMRSR